MLRCEGDLCVYIVEVGCLKLYLKNSGWGVMLECRGRSAMPQCLWDAAVFVEERVWDLRTLQDLSGWA